MMIKRAVFRYFGSKWNLAPWIISFFPQHDVYIEPFGGAANVLMRKPPSLTEIYNDLDSELLNVFQVMRERSQELYDLISWTPYHRDVFNAAYQEVKNPVERALNTLIKSFQGFGSNSIINKTGYRIGKRNNGFSSAHDWSRYEEHIESFRKRLKCVILENRNAFDLIPQHDKKGVLYYIDPPYPTETRGDLKHCYKFDCIDNPKFHEELLKLAVKGEGFYIISGYKHELYKDVLRGWSVFTKKSYADGAKERKEILWISPNIIDVKESMYIQGDL